MKKLTAVILVLIFSALGVFAGCSSSSSEDTSAQGGAGSDVDIQALASSLNSGVQFDEELTELDEAGLERVYKMDESYFEEVAGYKGSGATVDEISVWKATDDAAAKNIEEALHAYVEKQISSYETYKPDQVPKLENAIIERNGVYVALCVSEDSNTAAQIISDSLAA